ncbi:MAG TPA: DNA polymerase III subunit epsilon [Burkholderiaceae bacterium]|nr:DNA polymerase III subunit epsilon [Burkholderiaceae bacterium]
MTQAPRIVVLDTETTGLNFRTGDRIIEVGCVEILDRRVSSRHFHRYINPERSSDPEALKVHGITDEFLADKPKFVEIADELVEFVRDSEVVIHNASFDVGFLNAELALLSKGRFTDYCLCVTDTLELSKQLSPGKRHNLDALCDRYGISNAHRTLHGALLDAQLLAEVYLAMTRGQGSLGMELSNETAQTSVEIDISNAVLPVIRATLDELAEHSRLLESIAKESKSGALWGAAS